MIAGAPLSGPSLLEPERRKRRATACAPIGAQSAIRRWRARQMFVRGGRSGGDLASPAGTNSLTGAIRAIKTGTSAIVLACLSPESLIMQLAKPQKTHLSQSNRMGDCFFGQQGMPSAICMASLSAAAAVMAAVRAGGAAAINCAAGPMKTPIAIPSAKNQRMTARNFMAAKFHGRDGLRSPLVLNSATVGDQLHHALVRIDACEPRARVSS